MRRRIELHSWARLNLKSNLAAALRQWRHQLVYGLKDVLYLPVVHRHLLFQFGYLRGEYFVVGDHIAQANEGANDKNTHFHSLIGVEHGCGHDCSVFGKSKWEGAASTMPQS